MRRFSVEINGETFLSPLGATDYSGRAFRVTFRTQSNYTEALGLLDLKIYNLAESTKVIKHTKATPAILRLSAGYEDNFGPIFNGYIKAVFREREETNIVTHILCTSGYATARTPISVSFGRNSDIITVIQGVCKAAGYNTDIDADQFKNRQVFGRGYVANGDFTEVMKNLAAQFDFGWAYDAVRSSTIVIDGNTKTRKGALIEVNRTTGLIGYPEASGDNTDTFTDWTMRLSPQVRLGMTANLKSKFATFNTGNMYFLDADMTHGFNTDGKYKIMTISHEGDSWGQTWTTQIKGMK